MPPLAGLRIVEVEGLGPAPFAAMMLAEMGAEVIVIHRKGGTPPPGLEAGNPLDRGKRSIALDLKDAGDAGFARRLIGTADGLIEGFRPGVMERLGLGPEVLRADTPRLVYGRMTGWGQDGPRAARAGHDLNYLSLSGALHYAGLPGDAPFPPPTLLGDIGGGALYLVAGMLSGLLQAQRTGEGCVVDAAIVDGAAHMMGLLASLPLSMTRGQSLLDGPHWSRAYASADGRFVTVQCLEPKFYALFLERMGLEGDAEFAEGQFDRAAWPGLSARLAEIFAGAPQAHWAKLFEGSDACVAPVLSPEEAARDPHMAARGSWRVRDGRPEPAPAPRFGPVPDGLPIPGRDGDGAALRAEIDGSDPDGALPN